MPKLDAHSGDKSDCLRCLTEVFEALWETVQQVHQGDPTVHRMVIFYCKAGRHRSYALLIAFLMWSYHVHVPKMWEAIISPIRNVHLDKDHPCELATLSELSLKQRSKGHVAFCDCLKDYAAYLNAEFPLHAWPKAELAQF